ncbi:glycosyltransferase [Methylomonas koyamae]|uniref:glycosyltransferase n=1 Tax=Methylomonas koyamae TaxID=702114 RepID=UPI000AB56E63|nr:glycosyltransferase [Methylomonas koyamae]
MLTVVILACNEAANLPRCLAAIPERYPIVMVDSGSSDDTVAIAERRGCRVYHNPWPGFAEQRNFALQQCAIETRGCCSSMPTKFIRRCFTSNSMPNGPPRATWTC